MSWQSSARSGFMEVVLVGEQVQISSQAIIGFEGTLTR